jgi:quinol monooxygenase YgiN
MAQPETHTLCTITITVSPTNRAPFLAALRPVWDACVAEPENLFFDVFESPEQKGKFRFMEVWKGDKAWFMEVRTSFLIWGGGVCRWGWVAADFGWGSGCGF